MWALWYPVLSSQRLTDTSQILASPLSEPGANREGVKYVLERAEWYWNLSALLVDPGKVDDSILELQKSLRKGIVKLYKQLLLYQMKSVCLYSCSEPAVILRDLVKLDDWKAQITSIEKAAESVRYSIGQFRDEDMSARLRNLDRCLDGVRTDLQAISTAVLELGNEQRKRHDEDEDKAFLNDLYDVDPRLEKAAIEKIKGGMDTEVHELVLEQSKFEKMPNENNDGVIWITGAAGRGKTMLLSGIINKLLQRPQYHMVTYFFCRADRQKARTAKAVLRGLLWLICDQSWGLTRRLREKYKNQSRKLFEDEDGMVMVALALENMLADVLRESGMREATLCVDAIDECDDDSISILIKAIGRLARDCPARWIISSRVFDNYRSLLSSEAPGITPRHLELSDIVVSRAIQMFIKHKVDELSAAKGYDDTLKDYVYNTLSSRASDTFLWVALVCLELNGLGIEPRHVATTLETIPKELNKLYRRTLEGAFDSPDGRLCRKILPLVCVTSRPLTLDELRHLVPELGKLSEPELSGVIASCGSFLSVQGNDASSAILAFIHESAREYLTETDQHEVFPAGIPHQHRVILGQALLNIKDLTRNMYQLPFAGCSIDEIESPVPDPLSRFRYSCLHWPDHASKLQENDDWQASEDEALESFIQNDLLHWLEVLSLTKSIPQGTAAFQRLSRFTWTRARSESKQVNKLVEDARRFILYNKTCIEAAPLQVYASAILFSPPDSVSEIRRLYQNELDWVTLHPMTAKATWDQLVQELPFHGGEPLDMAFSPDGQFIVTAQREKSHYSVEIWDVLASHRVHSVQMDSPVRVVAFSGDGSEVILALSNGTVQRLDTETAQHLGSFWHPVKASAARFSPGNQFLGLLDEDPKSLKILELATQKVIQSISCVVHFAFCTDNLKLATTPRERQEPKFWRYEGGIVRFEGNSDADADDVDNIVSLWHIGRDQAVWTIPIDAKGGACVAFFGTNKVAVHCKGDIIAILAAADGSEIEKFPCLPRTQSMIWLGTGLSYMCWNSDRHGEQSIRVFDKTGRACLLSLPAGDRFLSTVWDGVGFAFCSATRWLSWLGNSGIMLWDLNMGIGSDYAGEHEAGYNTSKPSRLTFSPNRSNSALLASLSKDEIELWTIHEGKVTNSHTLYTQSFPALYFSLTGNQLLARDFRHKFQVWDTTSGKLSAERQLDGLYMPPAFSPNGEILALALGSAGVKFWEFKAQDFTDTIAQPAETVSFSNGGHLVATAYRGHIEVWAVSPQQRLYTLDVDYDRDMTIHQPHRYQCPRTFITFSPDDTSLAVATTTHVYVWSLGDAEPRRRLPLAYKEYSDEKSLALSSDGDLVAMVVGHHVWIWYLGHSVSLDPLHVELPHETKNCHFDATSTRLFVDGGSVVVPHQRTAPEDGRVVTEKDKAVYLGYGLSKDRAWVTKYNQRILYLPKEFRPKSYWTDMVEHGTATFMDSTVALGPRSGVVRFLRFRGDSCQKDGRW